MKFNFVRSEHLEGYHRCGWKFAAEAIQDKIHSPYGVNFYSWAENELKGDIVAPWVGIVHNVVSYPAEYPKKYSCKVRPLNELNVEQFPKCKGIYTLSNHNRDFLANLVDCPVESLIHPSCQYSLLFDPTSFSGRVAMIGQWMRRYHAITEFKTKYQKLLLLGHSCDFEEMQKYGDFTDVRFIRKLSNDDYDVLMSNSIVFIDFYDVAACNTIIECIMKNTPIITRRLPANEEYLGKDYPLFFDDITEVPSLLDRFLDGYDYLVAKNKEQFSIEHFIQSIVNSKIYRNLPVIVI